ncbi:class I adenylate-forming enzyme family protein [Lonsdalea quercina]|uniref:class I adenylate-forming enzyme family protein n=1 Tax=Lonsdalea quercina TaxID=71657 RepID=UPI003975C970
MTMKTITPETAQCFLQTLVQVDRSEAVPNFTEVLDNMQDLGLQPGEPVMITVPNSIEFVTIVFALLTLGAVPVLLPSSAPPSRIHRIAAVLGANALISLNTPQGLPQVSTYPLSERIKLNYLEDLSVRYYQPGDVILLTSGTSGIFSGCLFSLEALLLNGVRHAKAIGQTAEDRVLINLPMYYSYAFVAQLLTTFSLGGTAIIAGPPFTPLQYERTIRDYQITQSSLTPLMVNAWLQSESGKLPSPLRRLTVGGDALAPSSVEALLTRNPGLEVYLTYGLTQAGPRVATLAAHLESPERYASVGVPMDGVTVSLKKVHPDDTVGELIVATATGMKQRIGQNSEEPEITDDGRRVIHTGDLFEIDREGYLFFRQRQPSYVMSRGEKVCMKSVCEIAETLPGVARAEAWVHNGDTEDAAFTLDVYCEDASLKENDIRRQLGSVLLRSEQPTHLVLHPASSTSWRKTAP